MVRDKHRDIIQLTTLKNVCLGFVSDILPSQEPPPPPYYRRSWLLTSWYDVTITLQRGAVISLPFEFDLLFLTENTKDSFSPA